LSVGLWIDEKLITPAGYLLITAIISQNRIEDERLNSVEVDASPLPIPLGALRITQVAL
jgi:hypothetical protein